MINYSHMKSLTLFFNSRFTPYKLFLATILVMFWIWGAIKPLYFEDWLLENYLIFLFVPVVIWGDWKFKLSNITLTMITIFLCLHIIGAHYTYGEVPWGFTLQNLVNGHRNMYDRLVHFLFGFLIAYPLHEILLKITNLRGHISYYLAVDIVFSWSAGYEIMEWIAARIVAPEAALAFLGSQGDIWDAQKDMALAGSGAIIAMIITFLFQKYHKNNQGKSV